MHRMVRRLFALAVVPAVFSATAGGSPAAPAQRLAIADLSYVALNPCTGRDTTVSFTNQVLVIHDDLDEALGGHTHGTISGDASNSDGFSGRFVNTFGMNVRDISDAVIEGEFVTLLTGTIRDDTGRVAHLLALFHVTIPSGPVGELRGSVDHFSLECLGKPA